MSKKTISYYLSPEAQAAVDRRQSVSSASRTVDNMIRRYDYLAWSQLPEFTVNEWSLICDACNGVWMNDSPGLVLGHMVAVEVSDGCRLNRLHEKWGVKDYKDFVGRLAALPAASQLAVVDFVERFWADPEQTVEGLLREAEGFLREYVNE